MDRVKTEHKIMVVMWGILILSLNVDLGQFVMIGLALAFAGFLGYTIVRFGLALRDSLNARRTENGKKD